MLLQRKGQSVCFLKNIFNVNIANHADLFFTDVGLNVTIFFGLFPYSLGEKKL